MRQRLLACQLDLFCRHLAASHAPILIGPWRSEVGFEVLYWIPFLHRLRKRYGLSRDRLIAIGRGGSAAWYDTAGTADLYEHLPMEVVRALAIQDSQQTGSTKQRTTPAWERHVCSLTATSLGLKKYHVLSPSWMYQMLAPFWEGRETLHWLDQRTLHPLRLPAPPLHPDLKAKLPAQYLAMRWYARPTWPLKEDLILWTRRMVEATASRMPVVLIDSMLHADDHADMALGDIPNVLRLSDLHPQTPLDNLAIQSSVIAHAQGYLGTYGGMAQAALRWGVPTVALYHEFGSTSAAHVSLTHSISLHTGVPFHLCRPGDLDVLLPLIQANTRQGEFAGRPYPSISADSGAKVPGAHRGVDAFDRLQSVVEADRNGAA